MGDEPEDIIDEEELVMLREMKDLKKEYRDMFSELKVYKQDHHDAQQQIDVLKEKLLIGFENWYRATFEHSSQVLIQMSESAGVQGMSQ
jgi:glucose-6-phosphate 1-dehydrogenase